MLQSDIADFSMFPQADIERLHRLRLMDDDYMAKFFEDNIPCTELILHIILNTDDLTVTKVCSQNTIKNLQGRSVRLDIYAEDSTGKKYSIEIQRSDKGADAKRARYISSIIDCNITEPGEDYQELSDTYVIFITENDVLRLGKPIYHIERMIAEGNHRFNDGSHIIYVNGQYRDNSPLGLLMQDFNCTVPSEMNYPLLSQRARFLKEYTEGVRTMCKLLEDMRNEAVKDANITAALKMLSAGKYTYEEIAFITDLSLEEVKALASDKPA